MNVYDHCRAVYYGFLLEACCTKSCKLIGVVLPSISLCLLGKSPACDGLHTSCFLHALSCLQEGYLHIMPEVPEVSGVFSSCLSVRKCSSKPGKVSFHFGTGAKNRKCTAVHLDHSFWQEKGSLSGMASRDKHNVSVKILRNFYYLQAWILQGTNSETQPLSPMPRCLFWLWIFILLPCVFHTGTTEDQWLNVSSEVGQPAADWWAPLSCLPKHHRHSGRGAEWVATKHLQLAILHHWVPALFRRARSETVIWFPLVICQTWLCL